MKLGPAAVTAFAILGFGAGTAILFALGPTDPKLAAGETVLRLSDKRPTLIKGAAWIVCGPGGAARLVADGRSPGDLRLKLRMQRVLNGPGGLIVGRRKVETTVLAKPQGWFDHFEAPIPAGDLAVFGSLTKGGTVSVGAADKSLPFEVTAEGGAVHAFIAGCAAPKP
jgi:hypothetical protein